MWSGPRNISTAMMRSFEARGDCAVIDEPFYAAYLHASGAEHPMRAEVLCAQPTSASEVAASLAAGAAGQRQQLQYEKHMAHHMLADFGMAWLGQCRNAFLIRNPAQVLASYTQRRAEITLEDIGIVQQRRLFDLACRASGEVPAVIDSEDVLRNPAGTLSALCKALGIASDARMLAWPAGRRSSDGVWAPHWYDNVERSTGFGPPTAGYTAPLRDDLRRVADEAAEHYAALRNYCLRPAEDY
jgi:hypothetical protein